MDPGPGIWDGRGVAQTLTSMSAPPLPSQLEPPVCPRIGLGKHHEFG